MNPADYIPNYDQIAIGEWYKDGYFWRKKANNSWDVSDGKDDLIFNTCYKILRDKDKSDWAYDAIEDCSNLLLDSKRWPDRMSDDSDCKTWCERIFNRTSRDIVKWIERKINRQVKCFDRFRHPKFRYQGRMVRDSFIALYPACLFLGEPGYIEAVPINWYLYSPKTWRWRRRLIRDNRIDYVIRLGYLRSLSNTINYETKTL